MNKKNILIFPAGTEIAFEIVNALKYSKFVKLYGGTSTEDHSEFIYENLITDLPFVDEPKFLTYLNRTISDYEIDCIYPAHDSVCMFLSEHTHEINAKVIIAEKETTRICRSKEETYLFFEKENFIPRIYKNIEEIEEYPVFIKPSVGQGSNGAQKIESRVELIRALEQEQAIVISEYLPGKEYTVDCFTDCHGKLRVVKFRDRARIRAGISVRSRELPVDEEISNIAATLNDKLNFRGAWFFQVKKNLEQEYKLMEVSPRIPGTMGASRNMGINFPLLTLFDFWGYDIDVLDNEYEVVLDRAFYSAYRIDCQYKHVYVDYDDTLIVNGRVNNMLLIFIYQAVHRGIGIHLLSKHDGNIYEDMRTYRIAENLFDEIRVIEKQDDKVNYINEKEAIFIDDSFAERRRVREELNIPVFDVDMVESLIDWRI